MELWKDMRLVGRGAERRGRSGERKSRGRVGPVGVRGFRTGLEGRRAVAPNEKWR